MENSRILSNSNPYLQGGTCMASLQILRICYYSTLRGSSGLRKEFFPFPRVTARSTTFPRLCVVEGHAYAMAGGDLTVY